MKRFIYWIKKCLYGRERYCTSFCVTCRYYEECRNDGISDEKNC